MSQKSWNDVYVSGYLEKLQQCDLQIGSNVEGIERPRVLPMGIPGTESPEMNTMIPFYKDAKEAMENAQGFFKMIGWPLYSTPLPDVNISEVGYGNAMKEPLPDVQSLRLE